MKKRQALKLAYAMGGKPGKREIAGNYQKRRCRMPLNRRVMAIKRIMRLDRDSARYLQYPDPSWLCHVLLDGAGVRARTKLKLLKWIDCTFQQRL